MSSAELVVKMGHVARVRKLYKTILKLHRGMPEDLAYMGNAYVRDEFKRHKQASPSQTVAFMESWTKYAIDVSKQMGLKGPRTAARGIGASLTHDDLDKFSDEQLVQLHALYEEAIKFQPLKEPT